MLGLPADAVSAEPLWVSTGVEQLVIPIRSVELVRAAQPDAALLRRYAYSETRKASMAYLVSEARPHWTVRFFFTVNGAVLEDPSTGSACANLGGWLHRSNRTPIEVSLRQGEAVGRPSRLDLRVDGEGAIFVSGEVIELGRGEISL
jgi:PhzF family phenazine biosynthesis protein